MAYQYRIGDTFKAQEPMSPYVKLRVRAIEMHEHWDSPQYSLQLYTVKHYMADDPDKSIWGWSHKDIDWKMDAKKIKEAGLEMIKRGPKPAPIQMALF